jgi:hypothetical protein
MKRAHWLTSIIAAGGAVLMILIAGSQSIGADKPSAVKSAVEKGTAEKSMPEKRTAEKPVTKDSAPAEADKPKGRLPDHYAAVVDDKQREEIYSIQATYAPQIEKLQAQLDAVQGKRNAEIRAVLTPEQQQKVDALAEAHTKKEGAAKTGDEKAAVDPKSVKAAAETKAAEMKPKKGG